MSAQQGLSFADVNSAAIWAPSIISASDSAFFPPPVLGLTVIATVAGNVALSFPNGTTMSVPVAIGLTILPFAPQQVLATGTTATATYYLNN